MTKNTFVLFLLSVFLALPLYGAGIQVNWNPNTEDDLAGYKVYIGTASGSYTQHIDVGNKTSGVFENVNEKTKYYIAVTAYDTSGNESDYSEEATIDIPDMTPSGVPNAPTLVAGAHTITVNWESVMGASGYKLYYKIGTEAFGDPIDVGAVTSYTLTGLADKTQYYVALSSYDDVNNESDIGSESSVTTLDTTAPNSPSKPNLTLWEKIVGWVRHFLGLS